MISVQASDAPRDCIYSSPAVVADLKPNPSFFWDFLEDPIGHVLESISWTSPFNDFLAILISAPGWVGEERFPGPNRRLAQMQPSESMLPFEVNTRFADLLRRGCLAVVRASYFEKRLAENLPFQERQSIPEDCFVTGFPFYGQVM